MALPEPVTALLEKSPHDVRIALVGASRAPHKYGAIILRDLVRKGYAVTPVNPGEDRIDGLPCVATVADAEAPHIVDFVVPPRVALEVVQGLPEGPGPVLWFQPGAFDAEVVRAAEAKGYLVVAGPCIMIEAPA